MKALKDLKALNDKILFVFLTDIDTGVFRQKTKSGIEIIEKMENQLQVSRWAKVVKVGKSVSDEITPGQYILIENLKWTTHLKYNDVKFWMTDEKSVMAVSDEEPQLF